MGPGCQLCLTKCEKLLIFEISAKTIYFLIKSIIKHGNTKLKAVQNNVKGDTSMLEYRKLFLF